MPTLCNLRPRVTPARQTRDLGPSDMRQERRSVERREKCGEKRGGVWREERRSVERREEGW
eukprot:1012219-Rhodomonas_salina.1